MTDTLLICTLVAAASYVIIVAFTMIVHALMKARLRHCLRKLGKTYVQARSLEQKQQHYERLLAELRASKNDESLKFFEETLLR